MGSWRSLAFRSPGRASGSHLDVPCSAAWTFLFSLPPSLIHLNVRPLITELWLGSGGWGSNKIWHCPDCHLQALCLLDPSLFPQRWSELSQLLPDVSSPQTILPLPLGCPSQPFHLILLCFLSSPCPGRLYQGASTNWPIKPMGICSSLWMEEGSNSLQQRGMMLPSCKAAANDLDIRFIPHYSSLKSCRLLLHCDSSSNTYQVPIMCQTF